MYYRYFQKIATGLGVLVLGIGAVLRATDQTETGDFLLAIGGVILLHGLVALAVIAVEDRIRDRR